DNGTRSVSPTCVCRGLHSLPRAFVRPGSGRCRCAGGGNTAADRSCCCCCGGGGASLPFAAATPARDGAVPSRHRNPSPPPHGAAPSVATTPIIIFRCRRRRRRWRVPSRAAVAIAAACRPSFCAIARSATLRPPGRGFPFPPGGDRPAPA
ncbi:unnamed protein product, partial [Ectocarpus sp. 8 AP-2014]